MPIFDLRSTIINVVPTMIGTIAGIEIHAIHGIGTRAILLVSSTTIGTIIRTIRIILPNYNGNNGTNSSGGSARQPSSTMMIGMMK